MYVDLPTGQVSWHFHDSQAYLFDDLPPYTKQWDGHNTEEKYRRVAALRAGAAGSQWRTIDSAPRETEVFIGCYIDGVFKFGRSEMFYEQANEPAGETFSGWGWSVDYCNDSVAEMPTHWMPLPAAPKEQQ